MTPCLINLDNIFTYEHDQNFSQLSSITMNIIPAKKYQYLAIYSTGNGFLGRKLNSVDTVSQHIKLHVRRLYTKTAH